MHRTLNGVVRGLVEDHPEDWEELLPFAEFILRSSPTGVLGGRTPFEVVTGLKPKYPASFLGGQRVEEMEVGEYVTKLQEYMTETYKSVERTQKEIQESLEGAEEGHQSKEPWVGDAVLVRREPTAKREGPLRFQPRVYPGVYRICRKIEKHTFRVEDPVDPRSETPFMQPLNADRLVKIDMPELQLDVDQNRKLEIEEAGIWVPYNIERFAPDGRVQLRRTDGVEDRRWCDLSEHRYRWVL